MTQAITPGDHLVASDDPVLTLDHIVMRGVSINFSKSIRDDKVLLLIVL
jgi:hypothetical protein